MTFLEEIVLIVNDHTDASDVLVLINQQFASIIKMFPDASIKNIDYFPFNLKILLSKWKFQANALFRWSESIQSGNSCTL